MAFIKYPASDGLYLASDTSPLSSTLASEPDLIDGDKSTGVAVASINNAFGLDMGSAVRIDQFRFYDNNTGEGLHADANRRDMNIYESSDNSTWSLVENLTLAVGDRASQVTTATPTSPITARYFKFIPTNFGIANGAGTALTITELEAYGDPTTGAFAGSALLWSLGVDLLGGFSAALDQFKWALGAAGAGIFAEDAFEMSLSAADLKQIVGNFAKNALKWRLVGTARVATAGNFAGTALEWELTAVGRILGVGTFAGNALQWVLEARDLGTYKIAVMNLETGAITEYDSFNFDSIVQFGSVILLADESNLYIFSGSDDNGTDIDASFMTKNDNYNTESLKNLHETFITFKGEIQARVIGDGHSGAFKNISHEAYEVERRRIKFGRGPRRNYWQTEFKNVDGSDFEIDAIEPMPEVVKRKI